MIWKKDAKSSLAISKRSARELLATAFGINTDGSLTHSIAQNAFLAPKGGDEVLALFRAWKEESAHLGPALDLQAALRLTAASLLDPRVARRFVPALADMDDAFKACVVAGDVARAQRDWGAAEYQYLSGLGLYPNHMGYRVQYAHMLKELGKYPNATINYMTAFAQGETSSEMIGFIEFTMARHGCAWSHAARAAVLEYWSRHAAPHVPLDVPPTRDAVDTLVRLFLHRTPSFIEIANHLASCGSVGELCNNIVGLNDFATANRDFLSLVARKGRSALS